MGDVINLRQALKARKRAEEAHHAEANRRKHGRTKADKRAADLARQRREAALDGARREPADPPAPASGE